MTLLVKVIVWRRARGEEKRGKEKRGWGIGPEESRTTSAPPHPFAIGSFSARVSNNQQITFRPSNTIKRRANRQNPARMHCSCFLLIILIFVFKKQKSSSEKSSIFLTTTVLWGQATSLSIIFST